jgi:hypothetical protein
MRWRKIPRELLGMPKLVHDDGEVVALEGVCLRTASLTFFSSYQLPIISKLT